MCWNKDVSVIAFILIVVSSVILKYFGNKKIKNYNNILCYFFIFVGLMQIIDYLIWIDIDCKKGFNNLAGIFGILLNFLQPFILYLLINKFTNVNNNIINKIAKYINVMYLIIILILFINYIIKNNTYCSKVKNGHIKWLWSNKNHKWFVLYNLVMIFNIYYLYKLKYNIIAPIISYILLLLSFIYFNQNIGELWCFFVVIIPSIELIRQLIQY